MIQLAASPAPVLSILTPAVPSRLDALAVLCRRIEDQIGEDVNGVESVRNGNGDVVMECHVKTHALPVEHLVLLDNRKRTIGEKRDALLRAARGTYVAFVDDDDDISFTYVEKILEAAASDPDVITFEQFAMVNGVGGYIEFRLGNPNEPFAPEGEKRIKRNAWHVCAWRRSLAILSGFPASNYGEDWQYAARLCSLPGLRAVHIPEVLHQYKHSAETTEAPPPQQDWL